MALDKDASRFDDARLCAFVLELLTGAGMESDKAQAVTQALVEADRMGHVTHGLALLPWYMESIEAGRITLTGRMKVLSDRGGCANWDGRLLPGAWLISEALALAADRIAEHGVVTVAIRDSNHTGALAAYFEPVTRRGLMGLIACSSPNSVGVAPYGGRKALFTPNPIAAAIPTHGDPILLDISASITTMNRTRQLMAAGGRFPAPWGLDAAGEPTADPQAISDGGSLLPVGGLDHGHKGFALALLVEALTQGVAGFGRSDDPQGMTTSVFVQVIDPDAFGGRERYLQQTSWLAQACRDAEPRPGVDRVRVPGDNAARHKREARERGVPLSAQIVEGLAAQAKNRGIAMPAPLAS